MKSSCWTESGKFAFVHSFIQQPQMAAPPWRTLGTKAQPRPSCAASSLAAKAGARLQVRVPSSLALKSRFPIDAIPDGANEISDDRLPHRRRLPDAPSSASPTEEELTTTSSSGLQYVVVREGNRLRAPKASNTVLAHYSGWLTDGRSFDSSHKRGTPGRSPGPASCPAGPRASSS